MNELGEKLKQQILDAEKKQKAAIASSPFRAAFHLMPPVGWLNDPNGLCQFQGVYHIFFQYSPLSVDGGMKAWGHHISKDMIVFDYEGAPLLPDEDFDRDGVYSGCAWVENGKMHLYYTGNVKEKGEHDYIHSGRGANVVYVSSEDGIKFKVIFSFLTGASISEGLILASSDKISCKLPFVILNSPVEISEYAKPYISFFSSLKIAQI